jgi:hypothetical protein
VRSGIAVASTSSLGVGGVTSMLGLVPTSMPGVMDSIHFVRRDTMIAKIRGVKSDHMGVSLWKNRAYWRHDASPWCDTTVVTTTWEGILRGCRSCFPYPTLMRLIRLMNYVLDGAGQMWVVEADVGDRQAAPLRRQKRLSLSLARRNSKVGRSILGILATSRLGARLGEVRP